MAAARSIALSLLFVMLCASTTSAQTSDRATRDIDANRFHRRAVEAAYWGMPAVNLWAMREGFKRDVGAGYNAVTYFSKPMDWKLQVTTPNNSTLYMFSFWNTKKDGPIVVDVPPTTKDVGLFGAVMDMWQRPLLDVGDKGTDRGLGAKYLFLPPGYQDAPPEGYIPIKTDTYNGWFLLRTLLKDFSEANLKKGEAWIKQFKIYPLSQAGNPPATKFVDGHGTEIDAIAPYDDTFYDALNTMIQEEIVAEQDMVAMGMLQTIGIEKGKPFKPTEEAARSCSNPPHTRPMKDSCMTWSTLRIPTGPAVNGPIWYTGSGSADGVHVQVSTSARLHLPVNNLLCGIQQRQTAWCRDPILDRRKGRFW